VRFKSPAKTRKILDRNFRCLYGNYGKRLLYSRLLASRAGAVSKTVDASPVLLDQLSAD